jgi:hypothetical protein
VETKGRRRALMFSLLLDMILKKLFIREETDTLSEHVCEMERGENQIHE